MRRPKSETELIYSQNRIEVCYKTYKIGITKMLAIHIRESIFYVEGKRT